ncbi:synapsin-1-like [Pollicipes pollicipes]|uniref:synapsin-1-like n=1 Tax=Pollicipes pollicipes TaxID=41117 RepID=UPI0018853E76|nr:synapsin-1-like [Pollicipes pollicipes]
MRGVSNQPASVHQFHGDRLPADSLQQPHLTEDALQRMPVTGIGMPEPDAEQDQKPDQEPKGQQPAGSQALVAPDTAGLLNLASLFCRAGVPGAATPPAGPAALDGVNLHPYPRGLLQIVSSVRGPVGAPPGASEPQRNGQPPAEALRAELSGPAPPFPRVAQESAAGAAEQTAVREEIAVALSAAPSLGRAPPIRRAPSPPRQAELNGESQPGGPSDDASGRPDGTARSDASTVTAESSVAAHEPLPDDDDDDDDRRSVVSTGSTWSDISGFEEDLWRLRSVLRDPTAPAELAAPVSWRHCKGR